MSAIRVVVQQDRRFFRDGIVMVLEQEPGIDVVGAVEDRRELLGLCAQRRPDVAIIELDSPSRDPWHTVASIRRRHRSLTVVGTSNRPDGVLQLRARQAGVRTIVSREHGIDALVDAVRLGTSTAVVVPLRHTDQRRACRSSSLTRREIEVLALIGAGCTTREVSRRLDISAKTVENHKQRIFGKLGVQNQAHAVAVGMRSGLLEPNLALGSLHGA